MSDRILDFARTISGSSALQDEIQLRLANSRASSIEQVAEELSVVARAHGLEISADELIGAVSVEGQELTDAELDGIAGGNPDEAYGTTAKVIDTVAAVVTTVVETGTFVATGGTTPLPGSQIMSRMKKT